MTHDTAVARAHTALEQLRAAQRDEVWITLADTDTLLAQARDIDQRTAHGEDLPLAGKAFAVKDNIDITGWPTTAACPAFSHIPESTAPAVQALLDAGALLIGKTNLDQFATGLVGTRSPYGAVRNAIDPSLISGGSSSGSAVAVALGIVDIALGTDTAGSGRVPAGFNHIVGLKPTLGLVSSTGVVPACRSFDTVSVFARTLDLATQALAIITSPDHHDPRSRTTPPTAPLSAPRDAVVAIPDPRHLDILDAATSRDFDKAVTRLHDTGITTITVVLDELLDAARLLYDGALVAERAEAYGDFAHTHRGQLDPHVEAIVTQAANTTGPQVIRDQHQLLRARRAAEQLFTTANALMVPTSPIHPSLSAVAQDPMGLNATIGTFTNFVNLLDMAAVAIPSGTDPNATTDGITLITPAFHDQVGIDLAARILHTPTPQLFTDGTDIVVFGAHMRGMPLVSQLEHLGAHYIADAATAPTYRLLALEGTPPRPAVVACETAPSAASIEGELWRIPTGLVGTLVTDIFKPPLGLGWITLDDGSPVLGCVGIGASGQDITHFGGWKAWLATR